MTKYQLITKSCPLRDKEDFYNLYCTVMEITLTATSQTGFDAWFENCIKGGVIIPVDVKEPQSI